MVENEDNKVSKKKKIVFVSLLISILIVIIITVLYFSGVIFNYSDTKPSLIINVENNTFNNETIKIIVTNNYGNEIYNNTIWIKKEFL
jgi:uncharacterized membrane protein affecting hemolysin expression